jgi:hypothetical protein
VAATRAEGGIPVLARHGSLIRHGVIGLGLSASIFFLTYANGGFFPTTRAYAGIVVWWLIGVAAAVGVGVAWTRLDRFAVAAPGLLALFAIWTLISIGWAPDAERAVEQFDQVSLYVAVLVLAIALARVLPASLILGAVSLALSAVAVVALVSRAFPSSFGVEPGGTLLPSLIVRLSFPVGYWNGLGVDVALAYPLLLAFMTSRRSRLASALAVLPLPILASDMYLASSRGAFLAAGVAGIVYVLLAPRRWTALVAAFFAGLEGAVAIEILHSRYALVNGETTSIAASEGHHAMAWLVLAGAVGAVVWLGVVELGRRLPSPPRIAGWATAAVLVAVAIAGIVASHPIRKFHEFQGSAQYGGNTPLIVQHLLSSSGGGHWQFWGVAMNEFRAHPLNGGGAGSWLFAWLQHGSIPLYSQFAHSLYLETLAELGIVGLLLLLAAMVVALVGSARSALRLHSGEIAAAAACGAGFFASAAFEWIWQLAGVGVVAIGMLGVALGAMPSTRAPVVRRFEVGRPLLALAAVAAIIPQIVVLVAGIHLRNSQSAFTVGNGAHARSEALAAKTVEPWAEAPYLQLATIALDEGRLDEGLRWVDGAISRSPRDYAPWILATQIELARGRIIAAHRDLARVCGPGGLYPLSIHCQRSP